QKSELVRRRPLREEFPKTAVLARDLLHKAGVVAHRHDLGAIAHNARIARQSFPELVGLERESCRLKAEKDLLEAGPFCLDHAPSKTRAEHALGHLGENTIITKFCQGFCIRSRRQKLGEDARPSLAFLGAGTDDLERSHAAKTFLFRPKHRSPDGAKRNPGGSRSAGPRISRSLRYGLDVGPAKAGTPSVSAIALIAAPRPRILAQWPDGFCSNERRWLWVPAFTGLLTRSRRPTPCPRCRSTPRFWALALARWSQAGPGHARSPPPVPSPRSSVRPQGPGRATRCSPSGRNSPAGH